MLSPKDHTLKFHALSANPLHKLSRETMIKWIRKKANDYMYINRGNVMSAQDCDDDCDNDNERKMKSDETDFLTLLA